MPIRLPERPKEAQYEDYVAACFTALGYFIETRVKLRKDSSEVLELDVVATPSGDRFSERVLVEAKSGKWGFSDIFKVYGQRSYLRISQGCIAYLEKIVESRAEDLNKIGKETAVCCSHLTTEPDTLSALPDPCVEMDDSLRATVLFIAWFQQIAQRLCYAQFIHYCKTKIDDELVSKAKQYQSAVQKSFFERNPLKRVYHLYKAYQDCPNVSGKLISKLAGDDSRKLWDKVNDTHKYPWLQYVMLLEHRARLAIIKDALAHVLAPNSGGETIRIEGRTLSWNNLLEGLMPDGFRKGIEELRKHMYGTRIPYLMQVFIELFGGFYFTGVEDDVDLLARITKIPSDRIDECLSLIDVFFPFKGGWFYEQARELRCMKMVPGFVRGTGCFFRKAVYSIESYSDKYPGIGWLLSKWHNALYKVLETELRVQDY